MESLHAILRIFVWQQLCQLLRWQARSWAPTRACALEAKISRTRCSGNCGSKCSTILRTSSTSAV
eukprot:8381915-Lingulodinium_polyedra.AAC.1